MDEEVKNIIETAETKFIQLGIRNVSISDICNDIHISKKTFYKYFPQKENLISAVLDYRNEEKSEEFQKIFQNQNAIDALVMVIKKMKKIEDNRPPVFFHDLKKYYPEIFENFGKERQKNIRENFENNLRKGIEEGYYRENMDIEMVSYFHSVQLPLIFKEMQQNNSKISNKRMIDFFTEVVIRTITNEKGFEYVENKLKKDSN